MERARECVVNSQETLRRLCAENPFEALRRRVCGDAPWSPSAASGPPRSTEEISALVQKWEIAVHNRALGFVGSKEQLRAVLRTLAMGTPSGTDPIMGASTEGSSSTLCIKWTGRMSEDGLAVVDVVAGDEPRVSHVSRVIAFLFASDACFAHLMTLPKRQFPTSCRDPMCVNMQHFVPEMTPTWLEQIDVVLHPVPSPAAQPGVSLVSCVAGSGAQITILEVDTEKPSVSAIAAHLAEKLAFPVHVFSIQAAGGDHPLEGQEGDIALRRLLDDSQGASVTASGSEG